MTESNTYYSKLPVLIQADLAVVGGGPAGVAASVAASRAGLSTVLIDRWPCLGGMGTAALVNIWHTSDKTSEVILGFTRELVERLGKYGGVRRWDDFPASHETYTFSPEWLKLVCQDVVREAGVRTLCYTPMVDVLHEGRSIEGIVIATKQGLRRVVASRYIDASGDGDLAAFAGAGFTLGRESDGMVQGMTLVSHFSGIDWSDKHAVMSGNGAYERCKQLQAEGKLPVMGPFSFAGDVQYPWNANLMLCTSGNPIDNEDLTRATMDARARLPQFIEFFRKEWPGCKDLQIEQSGFSLGIREGRHVEGLYKFTADDIYEHRSFTDAIGHGFWMVDIHDPKGSGDTTWYDTSRHLAAGTNYQIPYRILIPKDFDNLLLAGRCASADHYGMAGLRIQTHCHIMGQAAGEAAAMSVEAQVPPAQIDVTALQSHLSAAGVWIDEERSRII